MSEPLSEEPFAGRSAARPEAPAGPALERLREQVEADPAHPGFPLWVEALRRAGRHAEALAAADAGLAGAPGRVEGRVALALVLLDLRDEDAARQILAEALDALPGADALSASDWPEETGERVAPDEIEAAFGEAEVRAEEMVSANDIAEQALAVALADEEDDEPDADAIALAAVAEASPPPPVEPLFAASDARRERILTTLDAWLRNLRRDAA